MDALDLLKNDHQRVSSLFEQFKSETGRQQQILLFDNIRSELIAHCEMEETVFYPAFKNYPDFKDFISESYEEHQKVKDLLKTISALPDDSADLADQVAFLMENVKSHVEEEEDELFPMVKKVMKPSERERLGRHMQSAKQAGPGIAA